MPFDAGVSAADSTAVSAEEALTFYEAHVLRACWLSPVKLL